MKSIIALALAFIFSHSMASAQSRQQDEKSVIYLSYCSQYGSGVSYAFQSCTSTNFTSIGHELGGIFLYCANYGDDVNYSFTSCMNSNFREAATLLNGNIFIQNCMNFDPKNLDFSFVSCVNSNFDLIARAINQRK